MKCFKQSYANNVQFCNLNKFVLIKKIRKSLSADNVLLTSLFTESINKHLFILSRHVRAYLTHKSKQTRKNATRKYFVRRDRTLTKRRASKGNSSTLLERRFRTSCSCPFCSQNGKIWLPRSQFSSVVLPNKSLCFTEPQTLPGVTNRRQKWDERRPRQQLWLEWGFLSFLIK